MIDLHAHVLPGLDDGPRSLPESLALLQAMAAQGVATVVAAVHCCDPVYNVTRDQLLRSHEAVLRSLEVNQIPIRLLASMELFLGFDLLRAVTTGEAVGLNDSKHLVLELPSRQFPIYTERALFELMLKGYRPILNHPERNRAIQKRPDLMYRLADRGVGAMVTAASLVGRFGPEAERLAREFLREGVATLVVSDAHNLSGRGPLLPDGLLAARECGKADQSDEAALLA